MLPPLNLDRTHRTSGVLPDGRTVPLAWDFTTQQIMAKVEPYMPWDHRDGHKRAIELSQTGQYLPDDDLHFRGVWIPAPKQIFSADYSRKMQNALNSGSVYPMLPQHTHGPGGQEMVGSTVEEGEDEEVDNELPGEGGEEEEANGEATTATYRASNENRPRRNRASKPDLVVKKKKKR